MQISDNSEREKLVATDSLDISTVYKDIYPKHWDAYQIMQIFLAFLLYLKQSSYGHIWIIIENIQILTVTVSTEGLLLIINRKRFGIVTSSMAGGRM